MSVGGIHIAGVDMMMPYPEEMDDLHKKALAGDVKAKTQLAMLLKWCGYRDKGGAMLEEAGNQGDPVALTLLDRFRPDMKPVLEERGLQGDKLAQYALAKEASDSSQHDELVRWGTMAANGGLGAAALLLGHFYFAWDDGNETNEDFMRMSELAVMWFTRAADLGMYYAMFNLALCFKNGIENVLAVDEEKALMWYRNGRRIKNILYPKRCHRVHELDLHPWGGPNEVHDLASPFDVAKSANWYGIIDPYWEIMPCSAGNLLNKLSFESIVDDWTCATRCSLGWSVGVHIWTVRLDRFAANISVGISRNMVAPDTLLIQIIRSTSALARR